MLSGHMSWRFRRPFLAVLVLLVFAFLLVSLYNQHSYPSSHDEGLLQHEFPLASKYIHLSNGTGGAWYIPPEWISSGVKQPKTIIEAARLAADATKSGHQRQMAFSGIPLLVHQTWKTTRVDTWSVEVISSVERWLEYAIAGKQSPMAYFFWDDDGMLSLLREFEPDFVEDFVRFFSPVNRADIFRILVCKWFGGIYGDVDTEPLREPARWIGETDIAAWVDGETGESYGGLGTFEGHSLGDTTLTRPVNLLLGIEADVDPASDSYWRMGYAYPVQLTQWALASAPQHPVLSQFMNNLKSDIKGAERRVLGAANQTQATKLELKKIDPLTLTGPEAVTLSTKTWLEDQVGLRWNALSGLEDGGKAKLVSDVLILPITGFSPGRSTYGNMGSKPTNDPDARLSHHAQGSWRKFDLLVEYGKFCRTFFGLCRTWSKVPA